MCLLLLYIWTDCIEQSFLLKLKFKQIGSANFCRNTRIKAVKQFIEMGKLNQEKPLQNTSQVEVDHNFNILQLMETANIEFDLAQQIYQESHQRLDRAIMRALRRVQSQSQEPECEQFVKQVSNESKKGISSVPNLGFEVLSAIKQRKQKRQQISRLAEKEQFQRHKANYRKTYIIKKQDMNKRRPLVYKRKNSNTKPQKMQEQFKFHTKFEQYLGQKPILMFAKELNEVFQEMWITNKVTAIHSINISDTKNISHFEKQTIQMYAKDIYLNARFSQILNRQFINFALDPKQFEYHIYPHMREFINQQKDKHAIILLRINQKTHEVVKVAKWNILEVINPKDPQSFLKSVQIFKKDLNRVIDTEICPSIKHDPLGELERRKVNQERKIRQSQDRQYKQMGEKLKQIQKNKRKQRLQKGLESDQQIERMKQEVLKSIDDSYLAELVDVRQTIKRYNPEQVSDPIHIKLRYPNGETQQLILPKVETLGYLYDYVKCHQQNLGFQNEKHRRLDLAQPWQGKHSFAQFIQQTLQKLFQSSDRQILIVKQL